MLDRHAARSISRGAVTHKVSNGASEMLRRTLHAKTIVKINPEKAAGRAA
jgi:hypothetical protein